ncbi:MAG: flagellar basal body FlgE domain-containing protein, partial [Gammaproteobacteria bacterium]
PLDEAGNLNGELGDIQLSTSLIDPESTTLVSITANVDSRDANPLPWDFDNLTVDMYNHSTSLSVYDSLGNPHVLSLYFTRDSANNWTARAAIDGEEMAETLALPFLDSGALNIDPDDPATLRNLTIEGWVPKDANGVANGAA